MFDDILSVKSAKKGKKGKDVISFGTGGTTGSTFVPMIVGYFAGFIVDALYNALGLIGYNEKVDDCKNISKGDLYQIGGFMGLTMLSFFMKNWSVAAFAFGVSAGSLTPKVATIYGLPRYLLFNIDTGTGSISPLFRDKGIPGISNNTKKPQGSKAMAAINDLSKNVSPVEMKKEMIQDQLKRLQAMKENPVEMYNMLLDSGGLDFESMNAGPPDRAGEFKIHGLALN